MPEPSVKVSPAGGVMVVAKLTVWPPALWMWQERARARVRQA